MVEPPTLQNSVTVIYSSSSSQCIFHLLIITIYVRTWFYQLETRNKAEETDFIRWVPCGVVQGKKDVAGGEVNTSKSSDAMKEFQEEVSIDQSN